MQTIFSLKEMNHWIQNVQLMSHMKKMGITMPNMICLLQKLDLAQIPLRIQPGKMPPGLCMKRKRMEL